MARDEDARRASDALALALEEAGFDVGRAFPLLGATVGRAGVAVVEVGQVTPAVASQLADLVARAAGGGLAVGELGD
ncbi:hypothetical protein [Dactylosporangium sp. CA-233914]|uniref:hypothetical protein n=1 Tax=Dactylosporangium sp. CA-233914 TaxID=3239934 RepID=UPI003D89FBE6